MALLADIEDALVARLADWELSESPVFAAVRGASGGYRPALRDALRREVLPAAYVAFIDEPTAPETALAKRGPRFSVLVAARSLRIGSDPRHDDVEALGAFTLIEQVRLALDGFEPADDHVAEPLHQKFLDADDRVAVYELLYRIHSVPEPVPAPGEPGTLDWHRQTEPDALELSWSAPEDGPDTGAVDFYRIYRKIEGEEAYVLYETAVKNATSRLLTGQAVGQSMDFYVTAVNVGGEGPDSNAITVML